jgi:FAD:protein FMN transferase
MTHTIEALGTKWWIEIFDEIDGETCTSAFDSCTRFIFDFEKNYSRFKSDSLISTLNQTGILLNPPEEIRTLLTYGKNLYLRTNTHFNLLTGQIQETHGYDADYSFTSKEVNPIAGNPIINLSIQPDKITLTAGKIDIGGYGKGYLIDEVGKLLKDKFSIKYFLINGGGDIFATSQHDQPIEIHLEHPTKPNHFIKKITLLNQGFAASSPHKRIWETDKGTFSHIITNSKIPELASFVKAESARDADAFATIALLVGEAELLNIAEQENLSVARFSPMNGTLWQTNDFEQ